MGVYDPGRAVVLKDRIVDGAMGDTLVSQDVMGGVVRESRTGMRAARPAGGPRA